MRYATSDSRKTAVSIFCNDTCKVCLFAQSGRQIGWQVGVHAGRFTSCQVLDKATGGAAWAKPHAEAARPKALRQLQLLLPKVCAVCLHSVAASGTWGELRFGSWQSLP